MEIFIIVAAVVICLFIELLIGRRGVGKITAEIIPETNSAEPGEAVRIHVKVRNESWAIYPFVRYNVYMPRSTQVLSKQHSIGVPPNNVLVTGTAFLLPKKGFEEIIEVSYPVRGNYRIGSFCVETGDFLGMKEYKKDFSAFISTAVYPLPAKDLETEETLGGIMGDFSVRRYVFEDPVLISGFREYSGREPMKDISWVQSARTARLMVKKYDYTAEMSVSVVLDTEDADEETAEKCFSIARTVCQHLEQINVEYDFFLNADIGGLNCGQHYFTKGQGNRHFYGILYQLAMAEYSCSISTVEMIKRLRTSGESTPGIILIMPEENDKTRSVAENLASDAAVTTHIIYAKEVGTCQ